MSLVAASGLTLFAGLNVIPRKSFPSEYSHRLQRRHTLRLFGAWQDKLSSSGIAFSESSNQDFHSLPYAGEHPVVEKRFVVARSRWQPTASSPSLPKTRIQMSSVIPTPIFAKARNSKRSSASLDSAKSITPVRSRAPRLTRRALYHPALSR